MGDFCATLSEDAPAPSPLEEQLAGWPTPNAISFVVLSSLSHAATTAPVGLESATCGIAGYGYFLGCSFSAFTPRPTPSAFAQSCCSNSSAKIL
jgi:hypothetical protein